MVTGSRICWPERSKSLWDRVLRVALRALSEPARTSDVKTGSENARLEEACSGRFESRNSDDVTGNAEAVGCMSFGFPDVTTSGTAGLSDALLLPLVVAFDTFTLDVESSSRLVPDSVPSAEGSDPCVFFSVPVT